MKYILLLFLLIGSVTASYASETVSVRLGDHANYVRLVLETPGLSRTNVGLDADGLTAAVDVAGTYDIAVPRKMVGPISAIDQAPSDAEGSHLIVHFRVPVKVIAHSTIPADASNGQRFVLDFQQLAPGEAVPPAKSAETKPAPNPPANPAPAPKTSPAPPANNPSFILSGFRSADFGASRETVLASIERDFGAAVRAAVSERGTATATTLVVTPPPLLPNTPPATITYAIDAPPLGLRRVSVVWNAPDGKGMSDAETVLVTAPMTRFFETIDFSPGRAVLNQTAPDGAAIAFEGIDAAGNSTRMTVKPTSAAPEGGDKRSVIELVYAAAPVIR